MQISTGVAAKEKTLINFFIYDKAVTFGYEFLDCCCRVITWPPRTSAMHLSRDSFNNSISTNEILTLFNKLPIRSQFFKNMFMGMIRIKNYENLT